MISKPVFSTNKIKMSWGEYIFTHLIPTWFHSFNANFVMWRDLVTGDYEKYTLLRDDEPFQECYDWFWGSINLDEVYSKEFLEYLMQMANDVDTGKVKTYSLDEVMEELKGDDGPLDELAQEPTKTPPNAL